MPFKSKAQRRKFAQLLVEGKITDEQYEEWNRSTGRKELPERVADSRKGAKTRATKTPATRKRPATKRPAKKVSRKAATRKSSPPKAVARARKSSTRPARRKSST
jgi:hypothetical protein